jgi:hypothetical protein
MSVCAFNRDFKVRQSSAMQGSHPYVKEVYIDREYEAVRHSRKRGNKLPLSTQRETRVVLWAVLEDHRTMPEPVKVVSPLVRC